jgi:hypothetical protein
MNDGVEALAIGLAVALVFSIPFAFFAYIRYLRYKETIALAERGLLKPERARNGKNTLRWGIVILFLGLATICGVIPVGLFTTGGAPPTEAPEIVGSAFLLLVGLVPIFFGLALITIHVVTNRGSANKIDEESDDDPIPPNKG